MFLVVKSGHNRVLDASFACVSSRFSHLFQPLFKCTFWGIVFLFSRVSFGTFVHIILVLLNLVLDFIVLLALHMVMLVKFNKHRFLHNVVQMEKRLDGFMSSFGVYVSYIFMGMPRK